MKISWISYASPIRDQKSCGSCSSFGTIGALEILIRLKEGNKDLDIDLSESDLFACSGGKCDQGNTMEATFKKALRGICLESCLPYADYDRSCGQDRCSEWWKNGKKIKTWRSISSISEMRDLLLSGPLVGVMAVHQSFIYYKSGVYHSLGATDPIVGNHCISILGFDDDLGAWLLRNSWSTFWGEKGYCWIKYGDSEIDQVMYYIEPDGDLDPDPEPVPICPVSSLIYQIPFIGKSLLKYLRYIRLKIFGIAPGNP